MERVLINTVPTISATFAVGSTDTDPTPDSATVTITRADGTVLVTSGSASQGAGPGQFTWQLQPSATYTNKLDRLAATWTSSQLGSITTRVEVCGGFLCPLGDLKALYPTDTDATLAQRRTDIEVRLEGACGLAFVPRYEREVVTVSRRGRARLAWGAVRSIRSATVRGTAWSADQIANLDVNWDEGQVWGLPPSRRHGDVTLEYEHGADFATEDARNACVDATAETFGATRVDGRVVLKQVDRVSVQYASPLRSGQEFVTPSVMRFIEGNMRMSGIVA